MAEIHTEEDQKNIEDLIRGTKVTIFCVHQGFGQVQLGHCLVCVALANPWQ